MNTKLHAICDSQSPDPVRRGPRHFQGQGLSPQRRGPSYHHDLGDVRVHPTVPDPCPAKGPAPHPQYGFFGNGNRAANIARIRNLLGAKTQNRDETKDTSESEEDNSSKTLALPCPCCGGRLIIIDTFVPAQLRRQQAASEKPALLRNFHNPNMGVSVWFKSEPLTTQNPCNHLLVAGACTSQMFKCAFWLFRLHWSQVLLVSTMLFAVDLFSAGRVSTAIIPSLLGYGYLAYIFHASLLKDFHQETSGPDATMQQDWHFWVAYLFPFVSLVGAALGIAFLIHSTLPSGELTLDVILSASLLISLALSLFVLSCFGTMIPAAIAKKSVGFKAALKRSRDNYWFVFWRLLVGPAFLGVIWVSLVTFLTLTELVPQIPETFSQVTVTNAFWSITVEFLGSFLSALCASIFSLAYLRAEVGPVSLVSGRITKA